MTEEVLGVEEGEGRREEGWWREEGGRRRVIFNKEGFEGGEKEKVGRGGGAIFFEVGRKESGENCNQFIKNFASFLETND